MTSLPRSPCILVGSWLGKNWNSNLGLGLPLLASTFPETWVQLCLREPSHGSQRPLPAAAHPRKREASVGLLERLETAPLAPRQSPKDPFSVLMGIVGP